MSLILVTRSALCRPHNTSLSQGSLCYRSQFPKQLLWMLNEVEANALELHFKGFNELKIYQGEKLMIVRNVCSPRYYVQDFISTILLFVGKRKTYMFVENCCFCVFLEFLSVGYTNYLQTTLRGKVEKSDTSSWDLRDLVGN